MPRTQLPVSKEGWSALADARKPVARSTEMLTQLLVFVCSPKGQIAIQLAHRRIERRAIIAPVVPKPASNDGIEHPGQIFDRLVTALWQFPATNFCSNGLCRFYGNRRTEIELSNKFGCIRVGHTLLAATQRYLTMTPELLHEAGLWFERYATREGSND